MESTNVMESKKIIDILNDLICINKDRIVGYEKALDEVEGESYQNTRELFMERVYESRVFATELSTTVVQLGGEPAEDTTAAGKLYRMWMDLKTSFTGGSQKSVFELCEFGEDVALKTYDQALMEKITWPDDVFAMLTRQRHFLQKAHDIVKKHRNELRKADIKG